MRRPASWVIFFAVLAAACTGDITGAGSWVSDIGDEEELVGMEEDDSISFATTLAVGDYARVCSTGGAGLRQRSGPGLGYSILRVMPEGSTVKIVERSGSWYKNRWGDRTGWSYGAYLCKTSSGGSSGGTSTSYPTANTRDATIKRAKMTVGFSYWWGGAAFKVGGGHGSCYGSCPSCSHSGKYGADCSGYVGKLWVLPSAMPMSSNRHPFSTWHFLNQANNWHRISRSSTLRADAMVYNSGGGGHIFLYESGDRWGSMWTYEARGCSYGIVHNLRTAGSAYRSIRRNGI